MKEKIKKTKVLALALGESTHTHLLKAEKEFEFKNLDGDTIMFKIEDGGAVLTHEEHGPMRFNKGLYYKTNQVEFNPFDNTVSNVFD
jgi:hypothetical protein